MKLSCARLYGDVLSNASIAGLTLTETSYAPSMKLPKHLHEEAYFCFVLEGGFTEVYGRRSRLCRPSTLVFHPAGETHSDFFHADSRCFNLQMNAAWLERVSRETKILNSPADFYGGSSVHLARRLFREFCNGDVYSPLIIEALALEILAEASRYSVKDAPHAVSAPYWLEQARELLDERFCERLSHAEIAELVGVHPVHLAREFRRFHRCTIGEYLRRLRVEFACRQLSSASDVPLSEIALAAGFFDQSHFARTFKMLVGTTPNQYRLASRSR